MKLKSLILPALNALVWGLIAFEGFEGEKGVQARVGGVSLGQVQYYVVLPLVILILAVIPAAILSQTKWSRLGNVWSVICLLAILPYGYFAGGGM